MISILMQGIVQSQLVAFKEKQKTN